MSELNDNDLRCGNWVQDRYGKAIAVESIYCIGINVSSGYEGSISPDYQWNEISPILLTEDILLKAGFTFSEKKTHYTNGYEYFDFAFDNGGRVTYLSPNSEIRIGHYCQYVHQLQNLYFSLTGTELTLQL